MSLRTQIDKRRGHEPGARRSLERSIRNDARKCAAGRRARDRESRLPHPVVPGILRQGGVCPRRHTPRRRRTLDRRLRHSQHLGAGRNGDDQRSPNTGRCVSGSPAARHRREPCAVCQEAGRCLPQAVFDDGRLPGRDGGCPVHGSATTAGPTACAGGPGAEDARPCRDANCRSAPLLRPRGAHRVRSRDHGPGRAAGAGASHRARDRSQGCPRHRPQPHRALSEAAQLPEQPVAAGLE